MIFRRWFIILYRVCEPSVKKILVLLRSRVTRGILQVLILLASFIFLYKNSYGLIKFLPSIHWRFDYLILAIICAVCAILLGVISWWFTLRGLGVHLSIIECSYVQLRPILAKYLPGYAWQYLGKSYLTHEYGVPLKLVNLGIIIEFGQIIFSGLCFVLFFFPLKILKITSEINLFSFAPLFGGLLLAIDILIIIFVKPIIQKLNKTNILVSYNPLYFMSALVVYFAAWYILGLSLWFTAGIVVNPLRVDFFFVSSTYTISFLVGFLIIFIPNGLGIRESVMTYILLTTMTSSQATLVSVLSRIVIILGDLLGMLSGLIITYIDRVLKYFYRNKPNNP